MNKDSFKKNKFSFILPLINLILFSLGFFFLLQIFLLFNEGDGVGKYFMIFFLILISLLFFYSSVSFFIKFFKTFYKNYRLSKNGTLLLGVPCLCTPLYEKNGIRSVLCKLKLPSGEFKETVISESILVKFKKKREVNLLIDLDHSNIFYIVS